MTLARPVCPPGGQAGRALFAEDGVGRLTNLRPKVGAIPSRIARSADASGHAPAVETWRTWYSLKRWKDLRMRVFVRDLFTCQMAGCGKVIVEKGQLVADHKRAHRGNAALFWDEGNVQTLCAPCHNRRKQAEEKRAGLPDWATGRP